MENLFSYGTLQLEQVQLDTFKRKLEGHADSLIGFKLSFVTIEDPEVIASSGMAQHPIIAKTNDPEDVIDGTVFAITETELHQADVYEVDDYKRIAVKLKSGKNAWVYINSKNASE